MESNGNQNRNGIGQWNPMETNGNQNPNGTGQWKPKPQFNHKN